MRAVMILVVVIAGCGDGAVDGAVCSAGVPVCPPGEHPVCELPDDPGAMVCAVDEDTWAWGPNLGGTPVCTATSEAPTCGVMGGDLRVRCLPCPAEPPPCDRPPSTLVAPACGSAP